MSQALENYFNPSFYFLGLLQKAVADGITRHCTHWSCPEVYLVPSEQVYYSAADIRDLHALCLAAPFDLNIETVPDWHPPASGSKGMQAGRMHIQRKPPVTSQDLIARPLVELLWYAALCASDGRLWQGSQADIPIRLSASPDFSILFHRDCDPGLAAFMLENSADLQTASTVTGVPLPQVFEFYNACSAIGLIDSDDAFHSENYLSGLLTKAKTDQRRRRCTDADGASVLIVPEEDRYYSDLDAAGIAQLCALPLSVMAVETVVEHSTDQDQVVQIGRSWVRRKKVVAVPKAPARPLVELGFKAALYGSKGRLLKGHQLDRPVRLNANPDKIVLKEAAAIAAERYIITLTAFMTANKNLTLSEIANATRQPLPKVIDFYNACVLLALVENQ